MAIDSRRRARLQREARLKREKEAVWKQLCELMRDYDNYEHDPKYKRLAEIRQNKHMPLTEAWAIVEKEFAEK